LITHYHSNRKGLSVRQQLIGFAEELIKHLGSPFSKLKVFFQSQQAL
jgi:hypothetical protein